MGLHKLLERQIKKHFGNDALQDPAMQKFVSAINDSYNSFERDKELSTHSFNLSEKEYREVNANLIEEARLKRLSISKLREAIIQVASEDEIKLDPKSDDLLVVVDYLNEQITKRKEVEERLRDLSLVSEETSNMVIISNANQEVVWVNNAFTQTSGYTLEEMKGKRPGHLLQGPKTDKETTRKIREALVAGQSFHGTLLNYSKEGKIYWNELSINPIKDVEGNIVKFISIATDVTERIHKNEQLLKSELKWKIAMEGSGGGVFEYDVEKNHFTGSDNLKAMLGLPEELRFLTFKAFVEFIHPESKMKSVRAFQDFLFGNVQVFNREFTLRNSTGKYVTVLVKAIPSKLGPTGRPAHILGTTTDISDIKQTELELANRVRQFKGLSENIPAVIYEYQFNKDGTEGYRYVSPAIEKVFGISRNDFFANGMNYIHPDDRDRLRFKRRRSRETHEPFFDESRLIIPGREIVWQSVSSSYTYDTQAGDSVFTGIISDVTVQKDLQNKLVIAREEAIRLAKTKETFLANMSHEIRTPLNGIIGMIRELSKMDPTSGQQLYLRNASTASQHLLSIVNNILDLSKIEAGVFDLERRSFSLQQVFVEVENMMKAAIMDKMLVTEFTVPDDLSKRFVGDSLRIRQILLNIMSNAVKFTENGFVNVDCKVNASTPTSQDITITVVDSGIGMDESFLKTIFNKFTQENDSIQRKHGGTGLGMAITYELVQMMKGSVKVSSEKGKGSRFDINLVLDVDMEITQSEPESIDYGKCLAGKKVLLVEDNMMNRLVATNVLGHFQLVTTQAIHGEEAIAILESETFDIILMDLQMPVMDGLEATRVIRSRGITTPIIALTANAFKSEIENCLAVGMNGFVTKPFDEEDLVKVLYQNVSHTVTAT